MTSAAERMIPPPKVSTTEWTEEHLYLPRANSPKPGRFDFFYTPHLYGIFAAFDDPEFPEVYCMKAAQVAWTTGLIAYLGKTIDCDPCPIIGMFAAEGAAREFSLEKLKPIVEDTERLHGLIDVSESRKSGSSTLYKDFPNGFLKMIGSNAVRSVKSTPAKIVFVEEPDDANENVGDQGDSVTLLFERAKRQPGHKKILGGTPSLKDFSRTEERLKRSDKRVLPVKCHHCGDAYPLVFENVKWDHGEEKTSEIYGTALPDTAKYHCPACEEPWDDNRRKTNIRMTVQEAMEKGDPYCGWVPTQKSEGVAGFVGLNELYSCLPGVGVAELVRDHLEAEYYASRGKDEKKIVFVNSKLGLPYEYEDSRPEADAFWERVRNDPDSQLDEKIVPSRALIVTCGIDVQDNRVAVKFKAWAPGEENWTIYADELMATNTTSDKTDQVWEELERTVFSPLEHEDGFAIFVRSVSIDSGGHATDAVYDWVRRMNKRYPNRQIMAIKGSSETQTDPQIFAVPPTKSIDHRNPNKQTKFQRYGLKLYFVGTHRAKDIIAKAMTFTGSGDGRMHWYNADQMRSDYFDQMLGEAKVPARGSRGKLIWKQKAGQPVEFWDTEVYALHAARAVRVHLMKQEEWDSLRINLMQSDLFEKAQEKVASGEPAKKRTLGDIGRKMKDGD